MTVKKQIAPRQLQVARTSPLAAVAKEEPPKRLAEAQDCYGSEELEKAWQSPRRKSFTLVSKALHT